MSRQPATPPMRSSAGHDSAAWAIPRAVRSVAVFRALQLGDMLCAVPALRALRAALPESEITLVGLPWAASFVRRFDRYLDAFLEFPGYPGLPERVPDVRRIPAFLADVQAKRFDLVIQMHGSGEITNPIAALFRAADLAGFYRPGQFCPAPGRFLPYPDGEPEIRRSLHLMRFLGVPGRGEYLEFPLDDADREDARRAAGLQLAGGRYACVHPGARAVDRRWPPEAFARVADALAARGLRVVLTGSADETTLTREVVRHMHAPAIDIAGRTSLGGLAAVVSGARLLVSNDTGVSHVADALAIPSVVVYTTSDPGRWAPLDRRKHRAIVAAGPSTSAGVATAPVRWTPPASTDHVVERVVAEALDLLSAEDLYAA